MIEVLVGRSTASDLLGMGSNPVERQCRRFLHDVTELTGEDQLTISRHLGGLDDHDLASDGGPSEADGDADQADAIAQHVFEARWLKIETNINSYMDDLTTLAKCCCNTIKLIF